MIRGSRGRNRCRSFRWIIVVDFVSVYFFGLIVIAISTCPIGIIVGIRANGDNVDVLPIAERLILNVSTMSVEFSSEG